MNFPDLTVSKLAVRFEDTQKDTSLGRDEGQQIDVRARFCEKDRYA